MIRELGVRCCRCQEAKGYLSMISLVDFVVGQRLGCFDHSCIGDHSKKNFLDFHIFAGSASRASN